MYKCRSFSSRYPIAAFKYYITYGLGANQGIFSRGAPSKRSTKSRVLQQPEHAGRESAQLDAAERVPLICGIRGSFSLFADQTTVRLLAGHFGFRFSFLNILICACCQVRSSFGHRWGLALRKGVDSHQRGETCWGVCLLPCAGAGVAGRCSQVSLLSAGSVAESHLPRDALLPNWL